MNEELKTKTDDFRKRAPIPKLFIIHFSFFIIHCSSLFTLHLQRQSYIPRSRPCRHLRTYEDLRRNLRTFEDI